MAARFRILGIPVQIDPWFLFGLFFVYQISSSSGGAPRVGIFAAVAIGVLTLIHELGHAFTARRFGCEVSVRLNLFVGWASYSSKHPLRRSQQILISVMGPASQLAVALFAMGVVHRLFQVGTGDRHMLFDLWQGLSWAGVVIGLLNLLPMWPLDGGHIVHHLLGKVLPDRAALQAILAVTVASMAAIIGLGVAARSGTGYLATERLEGPYRAALAIQDPATLSALWEQVRTFPAHLLTIPWFLLLFTGLATFQTFQALSSRPAPVSAPGDASFAEASIITAESRGWAEGRVPEFPTGWMASPWLRAHVAAQRGDEAGAHAALAQIVAPGRRWILPDPARLELAPLVARLPDPLPVGDPGPSLVLLRVLGNHGAPERLLHYASALYERTHSTEALLVAAAALVRRGYPDDGMRWLERAMREAPDAQRLTTDPSFLSLHTRPDYQQLVAEVRSRL